MEYEADDTADSLDIVTEKEIDEYCADLENEGIKVIALKVHDDMEVNRKKHRSNLKRGQVRAVRSKRAIGNNQQRQRSVAVWCTKLRSLSTLHSLFTSIYKNESSF